MSKNISQLSKRKGLENNLFVKMVGGDTKPLSQADKAKLADEFLLGQAIIQGSASFYDFTKDESEKIKVRVCNGSACLCEGSQNKVQTALETHFSKEAIDHITCLGRCHESQAFYYKGKNYSGNDIEQIENIINGTHQYQEDVYHVGRLFKLETKPASESADLKEKTSIEKRFGQKKISEQGILTAPITSIESFYKPLRELIQQNQHQQALNEVIDSKVRGRGGAGFPTGIKWKSCHDAAGEQKYIVCNADEGDPGAFSDRYLLEMQPHRVLFGMLLAGFICGAQWGVLYIRAEYPQAIENTEKAIQELKSLGLLGNSLNDSGFSFEFKIVKGAGAYICGEETALIRSIEGQRPVVTVRPPFPTVSGLFECPTVVNNVESFAFMPWIIEYGGQAFAQLGTKQSSGTKLVSLDASFNRPGIYEVEMGVPLQQVIEEGGQGFKLPTKALHIGGPLGGLVPLEKVDDLEVSFESFQSHGFLLGHASVIGIPESMPMLNYLHHLFEFTAEESCGKCFPCRLGATRGKEMMQGALDGKKLDRQLLDDLLETMQLGSLCALGGGLPLPIQNALQYFDQELAQCFLGHNHKDSDLSINIVEHV